MLGSANPGAVPAPPLTTVLLFTAMEQTAREERACPGSQFTHFPVLWAGDLPAGSIMYRCTGPRGSEGTPDRFTLS